MKHELIVPQESAGMRLDSFLAEALPQQSRSYLQKLVKAGRVTVNESVVTVNKSAIPPSGVIVVDLPEMPAADTPASEDFNFELLYEDPYMAIINKPPGVVVHPAPGNPDGTVVNAVLGRYPELRSAELPDGSRPGIVHRLDKDTSGCLAIARTPEAQAKLSEAFANRETGKTYLAIVAGIPYPLRGRIENLIGRHPVNRQKMAIVPVNGKTAISEYEVIKTGWLDKLRVSVVRVKIYTGRTHQIRVHMASLKTPVIGDELYGGSRIFNTVPRQMLHARQLTLPHPITGEKIQVKAPIPSDMASIIQCLVEE